MIQHWDAQSYEIQIRERKRVITRRVFVGMEDAARFASERAYEFGVGREN